MKKMNTKTWAALAVAALVVAGGVWALNGVGGDSLTAAVLKGPGKPLVLPAGKKVATTTATTTKPLVLPTAPKAPAAKTAPAPVGLCAPSPSRAECEKGKIDEVANTCLKTKKACAIEIKRAADGTLLSVKLK